jgi:uncharacterized membrane protein YgcG
MHKWVVCLLFCLMPWSPWAQEAILSYHTDLTITPDDKILIQEKIRVRAQGNLIRRGIYRSVPSVRRNKQGRNEPAPIEILRVLRDGQPEPYKVENRSGNLTLYIGSEDQLLAPGEYVYVLEYQAENHIGFFEDFDELYWNFVGHDWAFPVEKFSARLYLPRGAEALQYACYVGRMGSTGRQCNIDYQASQGYVTFEGSVGLKPGEGATLAVSWPKGYVSDNFSMALDKNGWNLFLFFVGMLFLGFYGHRWWVRYGVDPPSPSVVPDWHAPEGLSPADVAYVRERHVLSHTVSAALVSAAVKGALRIENKGKKFTFHLLSRTVDLAPEEKALVDALFMNGEVFTLSTANYGIYQKALASFKGSLALKRNLNDYLNFHLPQVFIGVALAALAGVVALTWGKQSYDLSVWVARIGMYFGLVVSMGLLSVLFHIPNFFRWPLAALVSLILTAILHAILTGLFYYSSPGYYFAMIWVLVFGTGVWVWLLSAPTVLGQEIFTKIKGFKLYLTKAEKELLDYFTPPEQTPELFEKYLPYAMALRVDNRWARKFKNVLAKAVEQGNYAPTWYVGNLAALSHLQRDFSQSVAAAAPKSSSGSGGGGFSGGGGGGGGGGGW